GIRERWSYEADRDADGAASREADDDAHRPRRIGLRPRDARHRRQRGSARCQVQKISAGKFHWRLPPSLPLWHARKWARRAMRAWIDRTNDGLRGMPADGISPPPKRGIRHVPPGGRAGQANQPPRLG